MDGMEGEMESQKSGTPDGMDEGVVEAEDETPTPDVETFEPRQDEDNAQTSGFEAQNAEADMEQDDGDRTTPDPMMNTHHSFGEIIRATNPSNVEMVMSASQEAIIAEGQASAGFGRNDDLLQQLNGSPPLPS